MTYQINPWELGGANAAVTTTPPLPPGQIVQLDPFSCAAPNNFPASFQFALISFWIEMPDTTTGFYETFRGADGNNSHGGFEFSFYRQGAILTCYQAGPYGSFGTQIGSATFIPPADQDLTGWVHCLMSIDTIGNVMQCYYNDVATPVAASSWASTLPMTGGSDAGSNIMLAVDINTATLPNYCMADLYMAAPSAFFDLSVVANRRKFIDASGHPVSLGSNGALPTGVAPEIFLTVPNGAPFSAAHTNSGKGGAACIVPNSTVINGTTYTYSSPPMAGCPGGLWPNLPPAPPASPPPVITVIT